MSQVEISVVVAAYNIEQYLPQCLESLKSQTLQEAEFIVVNDASTDATGAICEAYARSDSRFRIIHNQTNKGLLMTRKVGFLAVKGKSTIFLDGDNYLGYDDALTDLVKIRDEEKADILRFTVSAINLQGLPDERMIKNFLRVGAPQYNSRDIARQFFYDKKVPWHIWPACYRTEMLRDVFSFVKSEYFVSAEDGYLQFLISCNANSYKPIVTRPIYVYRVGCGISTKGVTLEGFRSYSRELLCISWLEEFLEERGAKDEFAEMLKGFENALMDSLHRRLSQLPADQIVEALNLVPQECNRDRIISYLLRKSFDQNKQIRKLNNQASNQASNLKRNPPGRLLSAFVKSLCASLKKRFRLFHSKKEEKTYSGLTLNELNSLRKGVPVHNEPLTNKNIKDYRLYWPTYRSDIFAFLRRNLRYTESEASSNALAAWGCNRNTLNQYRKAIEKNKPIFLLEDGFVRSLYTYVANVNVLEKAGLSYVVDTKGFYFDGGSETDLENLLNSYEVTEIEQREAKRVIDRIVANRISKYNNQPIDIGVVGKTKKKKVLVIDQSYGDMSLICGLVTDESFSSMLDDAIKENPDHEILFKIHPDTIARNGTSGFAKFVKQGVTILDGYANPIALLEQVDKVYVATSQMGFEALLCGKEVHVYGMPFYAGWGLTVDKLICERRKRKLNLYELFYIVYLKYSHYINPHTGDDCDVDTVIDYIICERDKLLNPKF